MEAEIVRRVATTTIVVFAKAIKDAAAQQKFGLLKNPQKINTIQTGSC